MLYHNVIKPTFSFRFTCLCVIACGSKWFACVILDGFPIFDTKCYNVAKADRGGGTGGTYYLYLQARSQPARWGGSELGWVEHQAHPPPLGHCPCDVIHIFQGWNKIAKGWNKIAEGWNKIAEGWNKIAEGWNKIANGWNKIAERWNKIAKGWNKIAKGWNKIFGMGNWGGGGRTTPPRPPPGYGPDLYLYLASLTIWQWGVKVKSLFVPRLYRHITSWVDMMKQMVVTYDTEVLHTIKGFSNANKHELFSCPPPL